MDGGIDYVTDDNAYSWANWTIDIIRTEWINGSSNESLKKYYFNCYLLVKIDADSDILGFICNNEVFLDGC